MSINHSVNTLLIYLSKCIDKTITPLELSYIEKLPIHSNDDIKQTLLHMKYYFLGWYIYQHLNLNN